jgi:hypothetical protein
MRLALAAGRAPTCSATSILVALWNSARGRHGATQQVRPHRPVAAVEPVPSGERISPDEPHSRRCRHPRRALSAGADRVPRGVERGQSDPYLRRLALDGQQRHEPIPEEGHLPRRSVIAVLIDARPPRDSVEGGSRVSRCSADAPSHTAWRLRSPTGACARARLARAHPRRRPKDRRDR